MTNNTKFYSSSVDKYYLGSDEVDKIYLGDYQVYQLLVGTTVTPNITDYKVDLFATFNKFYWKVQNLDASTVTIYTDANDTTPDYSIANVSSNAYTQEITYNTDVTTDTVTVYAKAQASGKNLSAYDSQVISSLEA